MKKLFKNIGKGIVDTYKTVIKNKRNIGVGIMLISQGLKVFVPELMTPDQFNWIDGVGLAVAGTGLAHHGVNRVNNNINNAKANKNK